tara:strand:- start:1231 stop:1686 length:456 start_codon:yes stop_codon:yes gene_type:complete
MNNSGFTPKSGFILIELELITETKAGIIMSAGGATDSGPIYNPFVKIVEVAESVKAFEAGDVALLTAGVQPSPIMGLDDQVYFLVKEYDLMGKYASEPTEDMLQAIISSDLNKKIERDLTRYLDPKMVEKAKGMKNNWKTVDPKKNGQLPG